MFKTCKCGLYYFGLIVRAHSPLVWLLLLIKLKLTYIWCVWFLLNGVNQSRIDVYFRNEQFVSSLRLLVLVFIYPLNSCIKHSYEIAHWVSVAIHWVVRPVELNSVLCFGFYLRTCLKSVPNFHSNSSVFIWKWAPHRINTQWVLMKTFGNNKIPFDKELC